MSTISTQLNWGSSYVVNDFYGRFINPEASEKQKVIVGKITVVALMLFSALFSFYLESAKNVFDLLLQIGAGTGLLFILRWFWHRINPWSEIAAMGISFLIAIFFFINSKLETPLFEIAGYWQLVIGIVVTTIGWLIVTMVTKQDDTETLKKFNALIFDGESKFKNIGSKIVAFLLGITGIYSFLFATGNWIYGETTLALILTISTFISMVMLRIVWKRIQ